MIEHMLEKKEKEKAISWLEKKYDRPFYPEYFAVSSLDEALSLLREYQGKAMILAGGLDVMSLIKARISQPAALINIKPLEKMRFMAATAEGVRIGALARVEEIEHSELILRNLPMLAEAAGYVGSPHIRRMSSLAGNLLQQTRCWYFRRTPDTGILFTCHRKGEPGVCHAKGGENQYHAVTGHQACASSFPSDLAVALSALDASVRIANLDGGRSMPVSEMYGALGTMLSKDEIVTSLFVPEQGEGVRRKFMKFRVRKTIDFAIVSAAVSCKVVDGKVADARIFLGGVAPVPYRARNAEEMMIGEAVSSALAEKAGEEAASGMRPLSKNDHKLPLIKTMVKRAILES